MGYVPFLRCYTGFRIPQPLEILENWGSLPFREAAEDIRVSVCSVLFSAVWTECV